MSAQPPSSALSARLPPVPSESVPLLPPNVRPEYVEPPGSVRVVRTLVFVVGGILAGMVMIAIFIVIGEWATRQPDYSTTLHFASSSSAPPVSSSSAKFSSSSHVPSSSVVPSSSSVPVSSSSDTQSSSSVVPSSSSVVPSSSSGIRSSSSIVPSSSSVPPSSSSGVPSSSSVSPSSSVQVSSSSHPSSSSLGISSSDIAPSSSGVQSSSSVVPSSSSLVPSSSSGPSSSSAFVSSSSSQLASSSSAPANTLCDDSPCLNGGTCTALNFTVFTCSCFPEYTGDTCQFAGCANPGIVSQLVNQTTLDGWSTFVDALNLTFSFPDFVQPLLLDLVFTEYAWLSNEHTGLMLLLRTGTNEVVDIQLTGVDQGIYRSSRSSGIINTMYIVGINCTQTAPYLVVNITQTECVVRQLFSIDNFNLAALYPSNFTSQGMNFKADSLNGTTLRVLQADEDNNSTVWITVRDITTPYLVYLTRWGSELRVLHKVTNLTDFGWITPNTEVFFDRTYYRLWLRDPTAIYYLNLDPSSGASSLLLNNTRFLFFNLSSHQPIPTLVTPVDIIGFSPDNLGNPYIMARYRDINDNLITQLIHYNPSGILLSSNSSVFAPPFDDTSLSRTYEIYATGWGDLFATDGLQLYQRHCQGFVTPCTNAQCNAASAPGACACLDTFSIIAGSGITNTGPTTITGNVGTYPTTTITGDNEWTITEGENHAGDDLTQCAKDELVTAYNTLAGLAPTFPTISGDIGGTTKLPGVYFSSSTLGITGTVTLNGNGDANAQFVFQISSALTTASSSVVLLTNGTRSCNVFWQIGSSATLGTGSTFVGNIVALTSITVTTAVAVDGRLLARNGAVTLDTNYITIPTCVTDLCSLTPTNSSSGDSAQCVYNTCQCITPFFEGIYPDCVAVNACATDFGGCEVTQTCVSSDGIAYCYITGANLNSWRYLTMFHSNDTAFLNPTTYTFPLAPAVQPQVSGQDFYNIGFGTERCIECTNDFSWGQMGIYEAPDDRDLMNTYQYVQLGQDNSLGPAIAIMYSIVETNVVYLGGVCEGSNSTIPCLFRMNTNGIILTQLSARALDVRNTTARFQIIYLTSDYLGSVWVTTQDLSSRVTLSRWTYNLDALMAYQEIGTFPGESCGALIIGLVYEILYATCATKGINGTHYYSNFIPADLNLVIYNQTATAANITEFVGPMNSVYLRATDSPNFISSFADSNVDSTVYVIYQISSPDADQNQVELWVTLNGAITRRIPIFRGPTVDDVLGGVLIASDWAGNLVAASPLAFAYTQIRQVMGFSNDPTYSDAAMQYLFPSTTNICFLSNGGCGTRNCITTPTNNNRCDGCVNFLTTAIYTTWTSVLVFDSTFMPAILFSDPFLTKNILRPYLFLAGTNSTIVYRFHATTGLVVNRTTTPVLAPINQMSMSIDTHTSILYVSSSHAFTTANSTFVIVGAANYMDNVTVYSLTVEALNQDGRLFSNETEFHVKALTIDRTRVVWILVQGISSGQTVLSKWSFNFTLIASQDITLNIGSTLASVSFSYDWKWMFFQKNVTFPVHYAFLGGMDYVPAYLTDVFPMQPVPFLDYNINVPASSTPISTLTTSSYGVTAITFLSQPSAFGTRTYRTVLLNHNQQVVSNVLLYISQTGGDVPSSSHLSSFGDLFTVTTPFGNIYQTPCFSRS